MKWDTVQISQFCKTGTGGTPSRSNKMRYYENGTIPWVKSGELRENIITQTSEHVTDAALRETSIKLVPAGALLLALYGATVGRLGILGVEATTNQAVCHIIPDPKKANVRYLFHALSNQVPNLIARGVGGAQPNISQGIVKELALMLPPLDEQKRIAAILDAADALRAKRRQSIAQLDALIQSTFLDLFGDPVTNPMGWKSIFVDDVCNLVRGSSPRPQGDARYFGGNVPRLMVADITRDGFKVTPIIDSLTEEGAKKSRPVPKGTIVMAVSGNVGLVATVQVPCCVHDGFVAFLELDRKIFDPTYFMFQFHFLKATHENRKAGAIFQNITTTDIKRMLTALPPLPLQQKFAAIVESIERQKTTQRAHLAELDALFAALQHRAFRGEL
jgi:type I restriction enzyme S subunit